MKCVIVSNRLPVTVVKKDGNMEFARSSGGLATGLDSLTVPGEKHWLGWAGCSVGKTQNQDAPEKARSLSGFSDSGTHP